MIRNGPLAAILDFFPHDYCIQSSRNLFEMIPYVQKPYNSILNHYNVSSDSGDMRHYIFMAAILDFCIFNVFPQQKFLRTFSMLFRTAYR